MPEITMDDRPTGKSIHTVRQLIETVAPRHEHHNAPGPADDR